MVSCCLQSTKTMRLKARIYLACCPLAMLYVVALGQNLGSLAANNITENRAGSQGLNTNQSRMHRTLLRARMEQLRTQGFPSDQINAKVSSGSRRTSSVTNDTRRLQRTVGRLSSVIRSMGQKVTGLENWKLDSELRLAQLENVVEQMKQKMIDANGRNADSELLSEDGPDLESQSEFHENIASDMRDPDFRLQQMLENDERIHYNTTRSRIQGRISKRQTPVAGGEVDNLADTVSNLNKTVNRHYVVMRRVFGRVGRFQRYATRRLATLEKKTKQARRLADETRTTQNTQIEKVEAMISKIENQELTLSLLQSNLSNYKASVSQVKEDISEMTQKHISELNETFTESLDAVELNSVSVGSLVQILTGQPSNADSLAADVAYLYNVQKAVGANLSDVTMRLLREENRVEELQESILALQKPAEEEERERKSAYVGIEELDPRVGKIGRNCLDPEKLDQLHRNLTVLETSFRDQMANVSSMLRNIFDVNAQAGDKIQDLTSRMDGQESSVADALQTCREDAKKQVDDLEAKHASCRSNATMGDIRALNETIERFRKGQSRKMDVVAEAIANGEKQIADLDLRIEIQESTIDNIRRNDSTLRQRITKAEVFLAEISTVVSPDVQRSVAGLLHTGTNKTLLQRSEPQWESSSLEIGNLTSDLADLRAKFDAMTIRQSETEKTREEASNRTESSIMLNNKEITALKESVKSGVKKSADAQKEKSATDKRLEQFELKMNALEIANASAHANVKQCLHEIDAMKEIDAAIENRLFYIRSDVDLNYNSTKHLFRESGDQGERLSILEEEVIVQIPSLKSSVEKLNIVLRESNESLWYEVEDIKIWLNDFQDAFDTSTRELGRLTDDFLVVKKNTSNHFIRLTTSVNYIKQVVQETLKAVDENRESLKAVNETILYLRLSIPSLSTTADDEGNFDIVDDSFERSFPFEDLETRSSHDNTRQQPGELISRPSEVRLRQENGRRGAEAALTLNADNIRHRRRMHGWMTRDNRLAEGKDYFEDYGPGSPERSKRFVKDIRRIDREVSFMLGAMESLQSSVYRIENASEGHGHGARPQAVESTLIVFSAGLTFTHDCCGTVVFDKVFSNQGSAYSPSTGEFTAPARGFYAFFVTVLERNRFISAALVLNGVPLITVRMDHSNGDYEQSQSTNTVVVPLTAGDQVWLQTYTGSLQGYQSPAVTFSGFSITR